MMDYGSASGLSQTGNYLRVRHSIVISSCLSHLASATHCGQRAALRVTLYSGVRCTFRLLLTEASIPPSRNPRPQLTEDGHLDH